MTRLPHEWPADRHDPKVCVHCRMVYGEELVEGEECAIRLRAVLDEALAALPKKPAPGRTVRLRCRGCGVMVPVPVEPGTDLRAGVGLCVTTCADCATKEKARPP